MTTSELTAASSDLDKMLDFDDSSMEPPIPNDINAITAMTNYDSSDTGDRYGDGDAPSSSPNDDDFSALLGSPDDRIIDKKRRTFAKGLHLPYKEQELICGMRRCLILEIVSLLSLILSSVDYLLFSELLFPYLHIIFMISSIVYIFYEMYFKVFKHVIVTFRASIIFISVTLIFLIDLLALIFSWNTVDNRTDHNTKLDQIIRDSVATLAILFFMGSDCVLYLSNLTRFTFPTFIAANTLYNLYDTYDTPNVYAHNTILTLYDGTISLIDIRQTCLVNIFLYCVTGSLAILFDWHHKYFLLLHASYKREKIFKLSSNRKQWYYQKQYHQFSGICNAWKCVFCLENWNTLCVSKWNEFWVIFGSFWLELLYVQGNTNPFIRVFLAAAICILIFRLIFKQFDKNILPFYLFQFRAWLLFIAFWGVLLCDFSDCFILSQNDVVCYGGAWLVMSDGVYYSFRMMLICFRDGMHLTWLASFLLTCQIMGETIYNLYGITFLWVDYHWVVYLRKMCYVQILILMFLVLYSLFKDTYHVNCVLIIRRAERAKIFDHNYNNGNDGFYHNQRGKIKSDIRHAKTSLTQLTNIFGNTNNNNDENDTLNKNDETSENAKLSKENRKKFLSKNEKNIKFSKNVETNKDENRKQSLLSDSSGNNDKHYTVKLNSDPRSADGHSILHPTSSLHSTDGSDVGRGLSEFYESINVSIQTSSHTREDSY